MVVAAVVCGSWAVGSYSYKAEQADKVFSVGG